MKTLLMILPVLFMLIGCEQKHEEQKAHDAKVAQQAREELLAELKAKEVAKQKAQAEQERHKGVLVQAGIEKTPNGKIIIDTQKTKSYFEQLAKKMQTRMNKLTEDMKRGVVEEKEAGIEVTQEKIVIDVNKTKGFMQNLAKKMATFVKEMDEVARSIEPDRNEPGMK